MLTIIYWYDDPVKGSWSDVTIPKTGQALPWWNYIIAGLCFLFAVLLIAFFYFNQKYNLNISEQLKRVRKRIYSIKISISNKYGRTK